MSKIYIGIDPGTSGSIAFISSNGDVWTVKNTSTDQELVEAVEEAIKQHDSAFALIERVSAMPGNGVASMFKFGGSFYALQMLCTALRVPFELVQPAKWQREMGCLTKGDKNISKARAQSLFPQVKVIHANADALLIAEHARRSQL